MVKLGNSIRLSRSEKERIAIVAGVAPEVKTVDGLNNFLDAQKLQYNSGTPEEVLLKRLLDSQKINSP